MTLPVFEVERVEVLLDGQFSMLVVTCPRSGCRGEFWVGFKWGALRLVEGANGQMAMPYGRNCPHCCAVSAIPEEYRIAPPDRPRRVVRRKKSKAGGVR